MVTTVMRILILASSTYLLSCGNRNHVNCDNTSINRDSSINQFILRDTNCFHLINNVPNIIDDPDLGEFIGFSNESSTEFVLLVRENGGFEKQFNYFYLTDSIPEKYTNQIVSLPDKSFHTTFGAYLGITESEFRNKYNIDDFNKTPNGDGYTYQHEDTINQYRCIYTFHKESLSHIEFGYVW